MRTILLSGMLAVIVTPVLLAQQFTPPAAPPGAKGKAEMVEAEILKVYSLEDGGATFRAYVVKYKGTEVVVDDKLSATSKKVGEKIKISVARVELPFGGRTIRTISFSMLPTDLPKKP